MHKNRHKGIFQSVKISTYKYHVFAPMGRIQLELIYLYFPRPLHQTVVVSGQKQQLFDGETVVENKGKLILSHNQGMTCHLSFLARWTMKFNILMMDMERRLHS